MKKITGTLKAEDKTEIAYYHYKAGHKAVSIVAHGFFNSKDSELINNTSRAVLKFSDVICFDFRGHGRSHGLFFWTAKEYLDLQAILEFAGSKYKKIAVIGFSLGAATSIVTASKTDTITSLVAVSAPTEFKKIDYRFWDLNIENDILYNLFEGRKGKGVRPGPFWLKKDRPIEVVEKLEIPVLYIHGGQDWVIRPWHSRALYEKTKAKKKLKIIKGGFHAEYLMRNKSKEFIAEIESWFKSTLKA